MAHGIGLYNAIHLDAVGNVKWFEASMAFESASAPFNDFIVLANSDGTKTKIWGTGMTYNVGTGEMSGNIHYIWRTSAAGAVFENIGDGLHLLNISAATFWQGQPDNAARFRQVFSGPDLIDAAAGGFSTLGGGGGADQFVGDPGFDNIASYQFADAGVTVNWLDGNQNTGEAIGDTFNSIENLTGSNFQDNLTGNNLANRILGGDGDDSLLEGAGGSDTIIGGNGNDIVMAGAGDDMLYGGFEGSDSGQHDHIDFLGAVDLTFPAFGINLTLGANGDGDVTYAGTGHDVFSGFEHVLGTELHDTITGNALSNILYGRGGNDRLFGLAGQEILYGGLGDDYLQGGADDDQIHGAAIST
jgi:Ca2+-binding RTX toxin-like protein